MWMCVGVCIKFLRFIFFQNILTSKKIWKSHGMSPWRFYEPMGNLGLSKRLTDRLTGWRIRLLWIRVARLKIGQDYTLFSKALLFWDEAHFLLLDIVKKQPQNLLASRLCFCWDEYIMSSRRHKLESKPLLRSKQKRFLTFEKPLPRWNITKKRCWTRERTWSIWFSLPSKIYDLR